MDFIPSPPMLPALSLLIGIPLLIGAVIAAICGLRMAKKLDSLSRKDYPKNSLLSYNLSMVLFAVFALGGTAGLITPSAIASIERTQAVIQEIKDSYGFELTERELKKLNYPQSAPTEDFKAFGSIENVAIQGEGYEKREIYLIWRDGGILIAESTDGESFTPLKADS